METREIDNRTMCKLHAAQGTGHRVPLLVAPSACELADFIRQLAADLAVLLDTRFGTGGVASPELVDIVDLAISSSVRLDPAVTRVARSTTAVSGSDADLVRVADVIYAAVRRLHANHQALCDEWGFSGFLGWLGRELDTLTA